MRGKVGVQEGNSQVEWGSCKEESYHGWWPVWKGVTKSKRKKRKGTISPAKCLCLRQTLFQASSSRLFRMK